MNYSAEEIKNRISRFADYIEDNGNTSNNGCGGIFGALQELENMVRDWER